MTTIHAIDGDEPAPDHGLPLLFNLVYCSRAAAHVGQPDVDRIITSARRHNPRVGITGLLVFGGGIFFQWLEGPRASVERLVTSLKADSRHHAMVILSDSEEVRERLFPEWDMELVTTSDIRGVLIDARDDTDDPAQLQALDDLLGQLDAAHLPDDDDH